MTRERQPKAELCFIRTAVHIECIEGNRLFGCI